MTVYRYADSVAELLPVEALAKMSGLAFLSAIADGELPQPPIGKTLNFHLKSAKFGEVVFEGEPGFAAMNPIGSVHGGWFGTILDSCMACAVQSTLPAGTGYTTLEFKVSVIRALVPGCGPVRAIGTVDHSGRRTGVASGRLVGVADGKLYATGTTTCLTLDIA